MKATYRAPYCPNNGCGSPNGAAPPAQVTCPFCGRGYTNFDKVCPGCNKCAYCGRVSKKVFFGGSRKKGGT